MADKIQAHLVLEILGRPPENVKEALNTLVVKLGSEKSVTILEKKYHNPVPVEDSKDLFTSFAEITVELETLENYFAILFSYMPSHIEIISPGKLKLPSPDLNEIANALTQRLHTYDAITKRSLAERDIYAKKLEQAAPEAFKEIVQQYRPLETPPEDTKSHTKKSKAKNTKKK